MSIRLLFDETFGHPIVQAMARLLSFHELKPEVRHLFDVAAPGTPDPEWVPAIVEGDWIVISADHGRRGGPKLPWICRKLGVTHVLLKGQMIHRRQFEKARAVLVVWPEMVDVADAPRGSRYRIYFKADRPVLEHVRN